MFGHATDCAFVLDTHHNPYNVIINSNISTILDDAVANVMFTIAVQSEMFDIIGERCKSNPITGQRSVIYLLFFYSVATIFSSQSKLCLKLVIKSIVCFFVSIPLEATNGHDFDKVNEGLRY